jgi:hypothetical protein
MLGLLVYSVAVSGSLFLNPVPFRIKRIEITMQLSALLNCIDFGLKFLAFLFAFLHDGKISPAW